MPRSITLSDICQGKIYNISGFRKESPVYVEKLHKMGFVIGTAVALAPVKLSDPMIVQIRGSRIALRRHEAQHIIVEECQNA